MDKEIQERVLSAAKNALAKEIDGQIHSALSAVMAQEIRSISAQAVHDLVGEEKVRNGLEKAIKTAISESFEDPEFMKKISDRLKERFIDDVIESIY